MLPQGVVADHLDHLQPVSELNMASVLMMTHNCNDTNSNVPHYTGRIKNVLIGYTSLLSNK